MNRKRLDAGRSRDRIILSDLWMDGTKDSARQRCESIAPIPSAEIEVRRRQSNLPRRRSRIHPCATQTSNSELERGWEDWKARPNQELPGGGDGPLASRTPGERNAFGRWLWVKSQTIRHRGLLYCWLVQNVRRLNCESVGFVAFCDGSQATPHQTCL